MRRAPDTGFVGPRAPRGALPGRTLSPPGPGQGVTSGGWGDRWQGGGGYAVQHRLMASVTDGCLVETPGKRHDHQAGEAGHTASSGGRRAVRVAAAQATALSDGPPSPRTASRLWAVTPLTPREPRRRRARPALGRKPRPAARPAWTGRSARAAPPRPPRCPLNPHGAPPRPRLQDRPAGAGGRGGGPAAALGPGADLSGGESHCALRVFRPSFAHSCVNVSPPPRPLPNRWRRVQARLPFPAPWVTTLAPPQGPATHPGRPSGPDV